MNSSKKDLSLSANSYAFPLTEALHKHYRGSLDKEQTESPYTKETLFSVGRFIEWQLGSVGLKRGSTAEEFQSKLGKELCDFLGSFYANHMEPAMTYKVTNENRDILVPSTSDSSSSEEDAETKWYGFNEHRHYEVPSVQESKRSETRCIESRHGSEKNPHECPIEVNKTENASMKYKGDTEISFGRIFQLGSVCHLENYDVAPDAPYYGPPVLTMSGFGELGRFGNQVIQYMFLKCCAMVHHASVQIPPWIGESLFCIEDSRVKRRFPAVVERSDMKANSTFTETFMNYIKASNDGRDVKEVGPDVLLNQDVAANRLINVDIWGWFQWHTSNYRPFRSYIYNLFRVKPDLKEFLDSSINEKLCRLDNSSTLVGIHIRLGDYKDISASSFGYCAPTKWYIEWLESIWKNLKNPVLFIASDEIERVEKDFASYNPKTCRSLGIEMPKNYRDIGADFFPDWYILTQCNVLAISNSTFSFTTCLLNQRQNARFYRAHYADRIVEIDPWNTDPIIHREPCDSMWKNVLNSVQLVYKQQGTKAAFTNIFLHLPLYAIRSLIMRTVLNLRRKNLRKGFLNSCLFRKRQLEEVEAGEKCDSKRLRVLK